MTYRGYRIEPLGSYPVFKIMPPGSGDIPHILEGVYTTVPYAKRAIDSFLDGMLNKKRNRTDVKKEGATAS